MFILIFQDFFKPYSSAKLNLEYMIRFYFF